MYVCLLNQRSILIFYTIVHVRKDSLSLHRILLVVDDEYIQSTQHHTNLPGNCLSFLSVTSMASICCSKFLRNSALNTHTDTHIHTHTHARANAHTHVRTHTRTHTHAHTRAHAHTRTNTHTHTYIRTQ